MRKQQITRLTDVGTPGKLPVPATGNRIYYDGEDGVPGFGVRVTANGHRSFVLGYWTKAGRQRRITVGTFPNWTVGAARIEARRLKRLIEQGADPLGDIEEARTAPTVTDLCDRFVEEYLPRNRPRTIAGYTALLDRYVKPHFGLHTKMVDVSFEDIDALHRKITRAGSPYAANRTVAVLSRMFSLAVRWRMTDSNPVKGIEKNPETKRKRYLSGDELTRLTAALTAHPDQGIANIFRLLLLTGARRGEVLTMRWADVDLGTGIWSKPGATTKQATDHVVPLSAPARQLLSELRERQSAKKKVLPEFVFPGAGSTGHVVSIKKAWRSLCKSADVSGLRIHDLRHSFASQLASGGASLPLIGALLGHTQPSTTHRYAHLFQDPQRAAVEKVAAIITAAESNGGTELTPPTPLRPNTRGRRGR
jgi:integrase